VAVNDLLDVFGEVWIDYSLGVFGERHGDLRQLASPRLGGAQHSHRLRVTLNDDFSSRLHAIQHGMDVARQICFADV